jgi:hypothetical protein
MDNPGSVVVKIRKEQNSNRVFLIFGGAVGQNNEFRFFKKLEIPDTKDVLEDGFVIDTTELKVVFIDNGDDKIYLQI